MKIGTRKYNGKTWEEWDETEYECPQEGCGGETSHVEEGYFQCKCGWFGEPISIIEDLKKEVERLLEEIKVLSKYRDIVEKFDDALLADGDTDIRWSAIYEGEEQ